MPRLAIVLEGSDATVAAGRSIRGAVEVDASEGGARCDGLVVKTQWFAHGRGEVTTGDGDSVELFRGEWAAGERRSYPFELPGPEGPLTYHGTEVNLDWRVVATADVPWAVDPRAESELVLVRGERPEGDLVQRLVPEVIDGTTPQALTFLVPIVGLAFLLPGVCIAASGFRDVARGDMFGVPVAGFGLLFSGAACFILFILLRNRIAAAKLGEVDLQVTPAKVKPGEEVRVALRFRPTSDVSLGKITARLVGEERAKRAARTSDHSAGRSSRSTFTHTLHEEEVRLRETGPVHRLQDVALEATLRVPEGAAPSLAVIDNEVVWRVALQIEIAGWPDWIGDRTVLVLPG
jgi:hypothetical protein